MEPADVLDTLNDVDRAGGLGEVLLVKYELIYLCQ